jgi:hypothetical protein
VFLALDHNFRVFGGIGRPILFETMVFIGKPDRARASSQVL